MTDGENEAVAQYSVDCFVAPAIILRPKAARDKGVGAVLCIDIRRIAKSVRVTHVTISLCSVRARACVSKCCYRNANTFNEIKSDSTKTDSFSSEGNLERGTNK